MSSFVIYTDANEVTETEANVRETTRERRRRQALREVIVNNEQENAMSEEERTRQRHQRTGIPLLNLTNMVLDPVPHGFTEI